MDNPYWNLRSLSRRSHGVFTHFEAGNRTDAVIKDTTGKTVANIEWEWRQPYEDGFNELEKLHCATDTSIFSALITYSHAEHHEANMTRITKAWNNFDKPLLVFLVRYSWIKSREFSDLETYFMQRGKPKKIRSQPALPWKAKGTRWATYSGASDG